MTIEQQIDYWVGRSFEKSEVISADKAAMLATSINIPAQQNTLPIPWHWIFHLDTVGPADIGPDGHAKLGVLMPDLPAKRRMFAGSKIKCHRPPILGKEIHHKRTISKIEKKSGKSGSLHIVTVDIKLFDDDGPLISEQQSIVYLQSEGSPRCQINSAKPDIEPDYSANFTADEVLLFRFSALTFNSHRIHFDKDYAVIQERYPERVVHAPLNAIVLAHYAETWLGAPLKEFSFRSQAPVFLGETTCFEGRKRSDGGLDLIARTPDGQVAISATASC